jgi:ribosomal protein S26
MLNWIEYPGQCEACQIDKKGGGKGKSETCENCSHPKLNDQNIADIDVIDLLRDSISGAGFTATEVFQLYEIPKYRRIELFRKARAVEMAVRKELNTRNGGKS